MNGHSTAETLAFSVLEIRRRLGEPIGDTSDAPVFIFSTGWQSGESQCRERLRATMADSIDMDSTLISHLARQLVRFVGLQDGERSDAGGHVRSHASGSRLTTAALVAAQAKFIRTVCQAGTTNQKARRWGLVVTSLKADGALYLQLLFPRGKFVFIHRDPIDVFSQFIATTRGEARPAEPDEATAASFAEHWCVLASSFELWHKQVDGILLSYDRAVAATPNELDDYLGECLPPVPRDVAIASRDDNRKALHPAETIVVSDRTREIATRLGYSMRRAGDAEHAPPAKKLYTATPMNAVHSEGASVPCAALVPTTRYIEPQCEEGLTELERRGYHVLRLRGCASIDQARSVLATTALERGFKETVWIDADTEFAPDDVDRLRAHDVPIVAGICARKGPRWGVAVSAMPGTREIVFGEHGGLIEVLYAGTGFLLVRREVYTAIQQRFNLPLCDQHRSHRAIPFFMSMLEDWEGQMSYLSEDFAFSRRARLCGYKIMADTSIRLWHIGMYRYGYEDAGNEVERVPSYRHVFESERRDEQ